MRSAPWRRFRQDPLRTAAEPLELIAESHARHSTQTHHPEKKGPLCVSSSKPHDPESRTIFQRSCSVSPQETAAEIAEKTVKEFNKEHTDEMDFVRFVLFDEKTRAVYENVILDVFNM